MNKRLDYLDCLRGMVMLMVVFAISVVIFA